MARRAHRSRPTHALSRSTRHVPLSAGDKVLLTEPRRCGITGFGQADEARLGAQASRPSDPEDAFLEGGPIEDSRPATVGSQQQLDDAEIPRLVASRFPGEPALEMPGWGARLIQELDFLPEHPRRQDGDPHDSAIHLSGDLHGWCGQTARDSAAPRARARETRYGAGLSKTHTIGSVVLSYGI
jgi:hypothetical protein